MRQIKFRYYLENGEDEDLGYHCVEIQPTQRISFKRYCGELEFRGQYTGYKDKNDIEIYEGDIISVDKSLISSVKTVENYEVVRNDDNMFYGAWCGVHLTNDTFLILDDFFTYEVIGNIYDNPELTCSKILNKED